MLSTVRTNSSNMLPRWPGACINLALSQSARAKQARPLKPMLVKRVPWNWVSLGWNYKRTYLLIKGGLYLIVKAASRPALHHWLGEIRKAMCMLFNPIMIGQIIGHAPVDGPTKIVHIGITNHTDGHANCRLARRY